MGSAISQVRGGRRFREMFANTPSIALLVDPASGAIVEANRAACAFYGYTLDELLRCTITDINPNLTAATASARLAEMGADQGVVLASSHRLASGETRDVEIRASTVHVGAFGRALVYVIIHDTTERMRAQAALHASEERYRLMFEENTAVQIVADLATGAMVDVNPAAVAYYGFTREAFLRMNSRELSGLTAEERLLRLEGVRLVNHHTFEQRHTLASGEVRDVEVHLSLSERGERGLIYTIVFDITDRKRANAELAYQALHDGLTGLPNRGLLHAGLQEAVAAVEYGGPPVTLLLLDLDRFKEVNDTLGHQVGDLLLQEIALRLQGAVHADALVARLGGDEFAILLLNTDQAAAARIAEALVGVVRTPLVLGSQTIEVDVSIGIASAPEHAEDADTLLRCADIAMYQAKRSGAGVYVYSATDDNSRPERRYQTPGTSLNRTLAA
jgi:diguanylate cyclase (GGDEF)-like protein/PAS domain S-box-containing protein